jgi:hypothetical protein
VPPPCAQGTCAACAASGGEGHGETAADSVCCQPEGAGGGGTLAPGEADRQKLDSIGTKLGENFSQVPGDRRPRTRDPAAKVASFKNPRTYEQAKAVVERGTPELTAAMDKGEASVSVASKFAAQPPAEHWRILAMPKDERRTVLARASEIKRQREDTEDMHLFMSCSRAVETITNFTVDGAATWAGLNRHYVQDFPNKLEKAISCLIRVREANPQ